MANTQTSFVSRNCTLARFPRNVAQRGMSRSLALLLSVSSFASFGGLYCSGIGTAWAEADHSTPAAKRHAKATPRKNSDVSRADPAARKTTAVESAKTEEVGVTGHVTLSNGVTNRTPGGGMMPPQTIAKSRSGLTRDYIAKQSPTSNPAALVASLPGVVYAGNDPLGTNDDQQGLTVRGLNQQEIGFLFEGIPAAAPVYLLPYTSAAADNENIQSLTLTQGSPDTRSPLYNAVGGELSETMHDPSHHFGG